MPIQSGDIALLKSQVLLDTDDGGGRMTAAEIVDGQSNNLFPDISELDRTYGRIALRKCYAAVLTTTTDSYYGAHAIIAEAPADPNVHMTLFSTKDWADRRTAAKDRVERYLAKGPVTNHRLFGDHYQGQKVVQVLSRPAEAAPKIGDNLILVQGEGTVSEKYQYFRVTKVASVTRTYTIIRDNKAFDISKQVSTLDISDALRQDFTGGTPDDLVACPTSVRETVVANAAVYCGIKPLKTASNIGDLKVTATGIFSSLVPSSQSEIPLIQVDPTGRRFALVPSGTGSVTASVLAIITPNGSFFIGGAIMPGSLTLSAGGSVITDRGGQLLVSGSVVGTIDYGTGVLTFVNAGITFTGTVTLSFTPAAAPVVVKNTSWVYVSINNRSLNYVQTLLPNPAPGTVSVSYMAQGRWYELNDSGNGKLAGVDVAYGVGTIDYLSGTVAVTLGALPDVKSRVIFSWGIAASTFNQTANTTAKLTHRFKLANGGVAPGSLVLSWGASPNNKSITDGGATLTTTADGTLDINYSTGEVAFAPAKLMPKGTVFNAAYEYGPFNVGNLTATDYTVADGYCTIAIPGTEAIVAGALSVEFTMSAEAAVVAARGTGMADTTGGNAGTLRLVPKAGNPSALVVQQNSMGYPGLVDTGARTVRFAATASRTVKTPRYKTAAVGGGETNRVYVNYPNPQGGFAAGHWINETTPVVYSEVFDGYDETVFASELVTTLPVTLHYQVETARTAATESFTWSSATIDLLPDAAPKERVTAGSVALSINNVHYRDVAGAIHNALSTATGIGTPAGSINYYSGEVLLTDWSGADVANTVTVRSCASELASVGIGSLVFRLPVAPIRPGSLQILATRFSHDVYAPNATADDQLSITDDGNGNFNGTSMITIPANASGAVINHAASYPAGAYPYGLRGTVDYERGIVDITLDGGRIDASSLKYNAVAYAYLPLSSDILGLDPVRLPSDGRVPIYRSGDVVVIHNTQSTAFAGTPAIGATLDVGRPRLAALRVIDAAGVALSTTMFDADLDAGTVTLNNNYVLGALTLPLSAEHRIEDMSLVSEVSINGDLSLNRQLTHNFPANTSHVSSALIIGDLQARAHTVFAQQTWSAVWADTLQGSELIAQYNAVQFPLAVTNKGALQERWAIIFTSTTAFRVVGESIGQIATGDLNSDCAPINPATGVPYFTLHTIGWGGGWAAGNVLRFNTAAANYPLWLARTVLQGQSGADNDSFKIQIRGDIDRV